MYNTKEELVNRELAELSREELAELHGWLILKLMHVNKDLIKRYKIIVLSSDFIKSPGAREASSVLSKGAQRLEAFNVVLASEAVKLLRK